MKKKTKLRQSWVWNKTVREFVKSKIKGLSLNICAGTNLLGSFNLDLDPKDKSVIKSDMKEIPFSDCEFDTVIEDPPWKIGYFDRWKPFFECVRVCKVGGIIIYNAYWIPQSDDVELLECWIRQDSPFTNTSIISVFKKIKHNIEDPRIFQGER